MKYNLECFKVKGEKQFSPVNQIKIGPALEGKIMSNSLRSLAQQFKGIVKTYMYKLNKDV